MAAKVPGYVAEFRLKNPLPVRQYKGKIEPEIPLYPSDKIPKDGQWQLIHGTKYVASILLQSPFCKHAANIQGVMPLHYFTNKKNFICKIPDFQETNLLHELLELVSTTDPICSPST